MDGEPTKLFASYEDDLQHTLNNVRTKLDAAGKDPRGEQGKAALRKVEMELDDAEDMVAQMEIEIQGIPKSIVSQYQTRLKSAKSELNRFKKLSKDLHSQASRAALLGGSRGGASSSPSDDPYGASDRTRLLAGTQVLSDSSNRLKNSERIALETESQGADILRNLRGQREQIENASNTLHSADTSIDRASGTLKKMIRQMYKQRIIFGAMIAVLVIIVIVILWAKLFRK